MVEEGCVAREGQDLHAHRSAWVLYSLCRFVYPAFWPLYGCCRPARRPFLNEALSRREPSLPVASLGGQALGQRLLAALEYTCLQTTRAFTPSA